MRVARCAFALATLAMIPARTHAAGFASNDNFIVYAPTSASREWDNEFAELVAKNANEFRSEFAREWLGDELPDGTGGSIVNVKFSPSEDSGLTWGIDTQKRTRHLVFITTTPERAVGCTLQHEIAHTVLATRYPYPNRLPEWVEEGIATRYDDDGRQESRQQFIADWIRSGSFPNLAGLLEADDIKSYDEGSYAAAASLVSYLLTQGDAQTILRFADSGRYQGWDAALRSHYGMESLGELQAAWREWLVSRQGNYQ